MKNMEREINKIKAVLNVIREKRKQLRDRIQRGDIDRESLSRLRAEDKIIGVVLQTGRASVSCLKLMRDPQARKKWIVTIGLMDEDPHALIKEMKKFSRSIDSAT